MASLTEVEAIFQAALEKGSAEERAAYLDVACHADSDLRRQVERLLDAKQQLGSFLEKPAVEGATSDDVSPGHWIDPADTPPPSEGPGTRIGPYKLLQQIGEGGMGIVYMAEQQEPVRRKVALKIIKPGMDSAQVIARFDAERQALALMDHQNIARVLDAGTTASGRPYFVMELVKGVPITKFCDDNHLTPRERLELFVPVCQAIQHAHQKGIIHRDIKPSNVLVTLYDGKPVPKVIDFGVAKAIEQRLTERTLFTQIGQVVGTLEYMSPEQAEINALDIDTRSDIYSLGVLLYELLTGSTPLEKQKLRSAAFTEMLRMIREEEPPKPSTRLSESREQLASISAQRKTEPAKLTKLVRGELDWIVMKALEKDRHRRYETANGFARDVQRYLADEPVEACPPSAVYKLRKFARKNRKALATTSAFVLLLLVLLVLGFGNAWWWMQKQTAAETEARAAFDEAQRWQQNERWSEALSAIRRAQGVLRAFGSDASLRQQSDELGKDLEMAQRLEEARLQGAAVKDGHFDDYACIAAYADAFAWYGLDVEHADAGMAAEFIRSRSILTQLVTALDHWTSIQRSRKDREWKHLLAVARAAEPDEWQNLVRDAWERGDDKAINTLLASDDVETILPTALSLLGFFDIKQKNIFSERVAALLRRAQQRRPADFWTNHDLAKFLQVAQPPQLEEAIGFYRAAVALRPQSPGVHVNLGHALCDKGQLDEAIAEAREALRLKNDYAGAHHNLGCALKRKGQLDEAIAEYREAIRLKESFIEAHAMLGSALTDQGQLDEAIAEFREALRLKKDYVDAHNNLGAALGRKGRLDEAIDEFREATRLKKDYVDAYYNLGIALHDKGQLEEAIAEYREAIRLKNDHAEAHCNLGQIYRQKGQFSEALRYFRRGHELGSKDPRWPYTSAEWVRSCERLGELDSKLPAILIGQKQPADNAERLALAELCQLPCKKLYMAAECFYSDTFAEDPKLADDLNAQHRYNAACAASLAGCGQGKDADKLDTKERARLRQQALDWLRADLKAYRQMIEKSADKAGLVAQQMQHWLQDEDFAGVRGDKALAKLPEEERSAWRKLWADVAELLAKAQEKAPTVKKADMK